MLWLALTAHEDEGTVKPGDIAAVIDLGSNSARLLVARTLGAFGFEVVDEERVDARLGEGQTDGLLSAQALQRGLEAMRIMASIAAAYEPAAIAVAGTEALRNATNANMLIAAAREATGLDIEILSGAAEAEASFLGVINSTCMVDGAILDLGGGSLEVMHVQDRTLVEALSVPLGAIYARERFLPSDPPPNREVRALRKAVRQQLHSVAPASALAGTGGAVRNLARIVRLGRRYPLRRIHGLVLQRNDVHRLARQLSRVTEAERARVPGVGSRAGTLHAAAIVVDEVMDILGADELTVVGQGLREGLLWRQLRPESPVLADVRSASVQALASANGVDFAAARPVFATALRIFDALAEAFAMDPGDRDLLDAAAQLGQIGGHVDYYDRDRHAEYLVLSGDLHGFSHREIVLVAAIVRWAASGTPSLGAYRRIIEPGDAERAAMLASILGIAQAVHRRMPSTATAVTAELKKGALRLSIITRDAAEPELAALARQRARFEALFARELQVRAATS